MAYFNSDNIEFSPKQLQQQKKKYGFVQLIGTISYRNVRFEQTFASEDSCDT